MDSKSSVGNAPVVAKTSEKKVSLPETLTPKVEKKQNITNSVLKSEMIEVPTNAGKFVETLRHSTTTPIMALADIIDNSIDAGASVISLTTDWITAEKKKKTNYPQDDKGPLKIILSDNGCGMNKKELIEAFKLGANPDKTSVSSLGCFGIGLNQSSLSFCRKFTVITRDEMSQTLVGIYDINHIKSTNKFEVDIHKAGPMEERLFEEELEKMNKGVKDIKVGTDSSGTVVVFEDIDQFVWRNEGSFVKNITKPVMDGAREHDPCFGEIFRTFISDENIRILVNGKIVKAYDPIRNFELICPIGEEEIKTNSGTLYFSIAELKTSGQGESSKKGIGYYTRGFYVMRNDRQIMRGMTFGVLPQRQSINNLRIEMRFSSNSNSESEIKNIDQFLKVSNDKSRIVFDEDLKNKIKTLINPYHKRAFKNSQERIRVRNEKKLDTEPAEDKIAQTAHRQKTIKDKVKETRGPRVKKNAKKKDPLGGTKNRVPKKVQQVRVASEGAEFILGNIGKRGPLLGDPYMTTQNKIRVMINREHPCYEFICAAGKIDKENPMLLLMYALAREEVKANDQHNDATCAAIEQFRYDVGSCLAIAMS